MRTWQPLEQPRQPSKTRPTEIYLLPCPPRVSSAQSLRTADSTDYGHTPHLHFVKSAPLRSLSCCASLLLPFLFLHPFPACDPVSLGPKYCVLEHLSLSVQMHTRPRTLEAAPWSLLLDLLRSPQTYSLSLAGTQACTSNSVPALLCLVINLDGNKGTALVSSTYLFQNSLHSLENYLVT